MATFTVTTCGRQRRRLAPGGGARRQRGRRRRRHRFDAAVFDGGSEDLIRLTSGQIEITDGLTIPAARLA